MGAIAGYEKGKHPMLLAIQDHNRRFNLAVEARARNVPLWRKVASWLGWTRPAVEWQMRISVRIPPAPEGDSAMQNTTAAVLALGALLLGASPVSAQCSRLIQNGAVQNGAPVVWVAPCTLGQAGPSTGSNGFPPMLRDLGVQGQVGILSGPITGAYNSAVLGWSQTVPGEFDINLSGIGGAPAASSALILDGIKYPLPGNTAANVVGPVSPTPTIGNLVLWNGGLTIRDGGPPVIGPAGTPPAGNAVSWGSSSHIANAGGPPAFQVPTISALKALSLTPLSTGVAVEAVNYTSQGDMPGSVYQLSSSPCSIGSGAGDGGSQVPSNTSGYCWLLAPQAEYDIRQWGLTAPIQFYVDASAGNDYGGANYCVNPAYPCATLTNAQAMVSKFDMLGQGPTVNLAAGTYQGVRISGKLRGTPSILYATGMVEHFVGAGYNSTFIVDNLAQQAVMQTADGMQFSIAGVTLSVPAGDAGLFAAGQGATITVAGASLPVRFNGLSNTSVAMHIEGNNRIIIGNGGSYIIQGTFNNFITVGEGGIFLVQPNTAWTCAGGSSIGANFISVNAGQAVWDQSTYSGCAAVSGLPNDFFVQNNGVLNGAFMSGTLNFPFGPGYIASGGRINPPDSPCIGGSGGCPLVVAPTGLGTGGTATIDGTGGSYAVGLILNTGSGSVATSGFVWLQYANYLYEPGLNNYGRCVANVGTPQGSAAWGSWPAGSMASITAQLPGNTLTQGMKIQVSWSAPGTLATSTGYGLNVVCNSG